MTQSSTESCPNNPDLTAAETTRHGVCYRSLTFFFSFFLSKKLSCGGLSLQPQQVLQHHWAQQETSADACRGSWEKSDFRIKGDESNSSWKRATLEQRGGLLPELLPSSTQQGRTAAALPRQSTNPSNHCRPFITPRLLTSSAQIKGAKSHRSLQAIPAAYSKQELTGTTRGEAASPERGPAQSFERGREDAAGWAPTGAAFALPFLANETSRCGCCSFSRVCSGPWGKAVCGEVVSWCLLFFRTGKNYCPVQMHWGKKKKKGVFLLPALECCLLHGACQDEFHHLLSDVQ